MYEQGVATLCGYIRPISQETRSLMKGIKRNLVPLAEFKGPKLELTPFSKKEIRKQERYIHKYLRQIDELETDKTEIGISTRRIADIEDEIDRLLAEIAKCRKSIRDVKIDNYQQQLSLIG